ncbi:MAG: Fic family protein [Sutterellaceae bacterium]|nr:Fic family protein [Sutterellaceae bacterium]
MRNFDYIDLAEKYDTSERMSLVSAIGQEAEKLESYLKVDSARLRTLKASAKFASTKASNAIESITASDERIGLLIEGATPATENEAQIAGYCDALSIVNDNFEAIPVTRNYILQLHKILYGRSGSPIGGKTKSVQNFISAVYPDGRKETLFTPLAAYETPQALDQLCDAYNRVIAAKAADPLIVIPIFVHDFLCIHPFDDGNGRMSRLLTSLLLLQNGVTVGKYVSLENEIYKAQAEYYAALRQAGKGWHEGMEDVTPFVKYALETILAAYKALSETLGAVTTE